MAQLHGVETIELTSGAVQVTTVKTAVIGLVGTAPDAFVGEVASAEVGSALLDNLLTFKAKEVGVDGNSLKVSAIQATPTGGKVAAATPDSAEYSKDTKTLTIKLGCDAGGALTATAASVAAVVNGLADCPISAVGTTGVGLVSPFQVSLFGGESEPFPLNQPVAVIGMTQARKLGVRGSLYAALSEVFDQDGALVIVVRVGDESETEAQRANLLRGINALMESKSKTTFTPRILIATGYSEDDAVAKALEAAAAKLRAVAYIDSLPMATAQSVALRRGLFGDRVEILRPRVARSDASGMITYRPYSACAAGLRSRTDREKGWWWSKSNQPIMNIIGLEQIDSFALNDANCVANLLNMTEVSTIIRYDGFRHWGNRLCSKHPQLRFESVRRTADVIEDSIEETMMLFMDRPIDKFVVEDITGTINSYMRQLTALGAIFGGTSWPDPELNTAESIAAGELYINYDFGPKSPLEKLTMRVRINNDYSIQELTA